MTVISSHVLDAVLGDHAKGIQIRLFRLVNERRELLFDVVGDEQGRILEEVALEGEIVNVEMVFETAVYFHSQNIAQNVPQMMDEVVVRFKVAPHTKKVHIPLVLSPHSYTIWWSS